MMATIGDDVRLETGSWHDLDSVMSVMNSAFGDRYGEAWTRSQLAGILPMAGVSLMLARSRGYDEMARMIEDALAARARPRPL